MDSYLDHVKKEITVLLNAREGVLCNGTAKDFAGYKEVVGQITGLKLAINEIDTLQVRSLPATPC